MVALAQETDERQIPLRVLPFEPAVIEGRDQGLAVAIEPMQVQFHVQNVGQRNPRILLSDPHLPQPLPILRLAVNAVATFVLVMVAGLILTATAPRVFGYGSVVVASGSMEPAIKVADVVVTSPTDGLGLDLGAVINFDYQESTRLHRIAAVTDDGYRTAGDANRTLDSEPVVPAQIRGIGIVVVPFVGLPATWVGNGQWALLALTLVVMVGAIHVSRASWTEPPDPLRS